LTALLAVNLTVKVVAEEALTYTSWIPVALPTAVVFLTSIAFGAAPNVLLNVSIVSHVLGVPVVPDVTTNDPALSVEPLVTVAEGPVPPPQLVGVPIVGLLV
jgi:hypothetical protein